MKEILKSVTGENRTKKQTVALLADAITVLNIKDTIESYHKAMTAELNKRDENQLDDLLVVIAEQCKKDLETFQWFSALIENLTE